MDKPFSQACINNRGPIADILERVFANKRDILEIGSGSGQHAVWFASKMPHL
jgi:tRNA G46 methylase TrmB